ncbi:MAG: calcium/sodium antiporter [Stappiaceae bacterium]
MLDYVSLIGGLILLLIAGDVLVRGSVGIAEQLNIPPIVIGLTIVAFGTSAPELVISLRAALNDAPGIALGNVVGSNITNVLLVMGVPALIAQTDCDEKGSFRTAVFMLAITVVFIALCQFSPLTMASGIALLALLTLYLLDNVRASRRARAVHRENASIATTQENHELIDGVEGVPHRPGLAILFVFVGLIGLPLGAHFTIEGATALARSWGVTETVIGLTVIALGTSLPELATTLMAIARKQGAVGLGNVIGSNIFNLLAIVGTTAVVVPIAVPAELLRFDVWVMLGVTVLLFLFAWLKVKIGLTIGLALVTAYAIYIYLVFVTGHVS